MVSIIVAYDERRVIGNKGMLPWHLPEDLKHFKQVTVGCPIILGRKTWESLPRKPLPDRMNIVLSRDWEEEKDKLPLAPAYFMTTLKGAIDVARDALPGKDVWIIGGAQIYQEALAEDHVDRVLATEVRGVHEGDVFLPLMGDKWVRRVLNQYEKFSIVDYRMHPMYT